jgi:hypothetical protein
MFNFRSFITTLCVFTSTLLLLAFVVVERPIIVQNAVEITTSALPIIRNAITQAGSNVPVIFAREIEFVEPGASSTYGIASCLPCY